MGENQLIVLTGGPGTGKSQLLATLQKKGFHCYEEISRQVIDKGKRQGMSNYFLSSPLAFSKELFEGRKTQHQSAKALPYDTEKPYVFLDRGLPDVVAYLKALGENTEAWETEMIKFPYDKVVFFPPWEAIYQKDAQRMETFERAQELSDQLWQLYQSYYLDMIVIPPGSLAERAQTLLKALQP